MARGNSGRIVLEIDPTIKDQLYIALARNKLTVKQWFLTQCEIYINSVMQASLFPEIVADTEQQYSGEKLN